MDQISVLAAAGMQSRMQSLDLLANNIANASSSGYKGDSEFYTLFTSEAANEDATDTPTTMPMIQRQWTDFAQGLLEPTNNPMDFGLAGKGFFVVSGPSGPLYTRSGNFQILPSGKLATLEGYPVLGQDGQSITADVNQPIEVLQDGTIRQNGQDLAQLQLANFNDTSILTKQGNNYFRSTTDQKPVDPTDLKVYQGKVEAANVGAAQSAVRLVGLTRQFEMMQKALSISSDMSREAIEQVAKI